MQRKPETGGRDLLQCVLQSVQAPILAVEAPEVRMRKRADVAVQILRLRLQEQEEGQLEGAPEEQAQRCEAFCGHRPRINCSNFM